MAFMAYFKNLLKIVWKYPHFRVNNSHRKTICTETGLLGLWLIFHKCIPRLLHPVILHMGVFSDWYVLLFAWTHLELDFFLSLFLFIYTRSLLTQLFHCVYFSAVMLTKQDTVINNSSNMLIIIGNVFFLCFLGAI